MQGTLEVTKAETERNIQAERAAFESLPFLYDLVSRAGLEPATR